MLIYIIIEFPPLPHTDDSGSCWPRMNFVPIAARRASPRPRPGRKGYDRQITLVLAAASQPGTVLDLPQRTSTLSDNGLDWRKTML